MVHVGGARLGGRRGRPSSSAEEAGVAASVDRLLATLDPDLSGELALVLDLLENPVAGALLDGHPMPLSPPLNPPTGSRRLLPALEPAQAAQSRNAGARCADQQRLLEPHGDLGAYGLRSARPSRRRQTGSLIDAAKLGAALPRRRRGDCRVGRGRLGARTRLTAAGLRVVMLEAGPWVTKERLTLREEDAFQGMYQDRGTRFTGDGSIGILQGRCGRRTTVNWTTCYRTPDRVLEHWAKVHGVTGLSSAVLEPHFDAVEGRLNIAPWPARARQRQQPEAVGWGEEAGLAGGADKAQRQGLRQLGLLRHGLPGGRQAGDARDLSSGRPGGRPTLVVNCPVDRLERQGARMTGVKGRAHLPAAGRAAGKRSPSQRRRWS